jgi:hypothetical protein
VLAADAAIQVNVAERLEARVLSWTDLVDTVYWANFNTRLAAGTTISMDHGQNLGNDLSRLAGQGRCCHLLGSNEFEKKSTTANR